MKSGEGGRWGGVGTGDQTAKWPSAFAIPLMNNRVHFSLLLIIVLCASSPQKNNNHQLFQIASEGRQRARRALSLSHPQGHSEGGLLYRL